MYPLFKTPEVSAFSVNYGLFVFSVYNPCYPSPEIDNPLKCKKPGLRKKAEQVQSTNRGSVFLLYRTLLIYTEFCELT